MDTIVYPRNIKVVYAGRRLLSSKKLGFLYYEIKENGTAGTTTDAMLLFEKKMGYDIIGYIFGLIQTTETNFKLSSAVHLGHYDNKDTVAEWKALSAGAETEKDLLKEEKESDEWEQTLRPIRAAYCQARTRKQQAAIIARVIRAIQG